MVSRLAQIFNSDILRELEKKNDRGRKNNDWFSGYAIWNNPKTSFA